MTFHLAVRAHGSHGINQWPHSSWGLRAPWLKGWLPPQRCHAPHGSLPVPVELHPVIPGTPDRIALPNDAPASSHSSLAPSVPRCYLMGVTVQLLLSPIFPTLI